MGTSFTLCGTLLLFTGSFAFALPVAPLRGDVVGSDAEPAIYHSGQPARVTRVFDENVNIETSTKPLPDAQGINITPEKANDYGADFDNVIVVNKAVDKDGFQWMTIYRYHQTENGNRKPLEVRRFKISTGREVWRCENKLDQDRKPTGQLEARWLGTPTGFYSPYACEAVHTSNTYDDAKMRNACFFNKLGIAFHKPDVREPGPAPALTSDAATDARNAQTYAKRLAAYQSAAAKAMGPRQSHGCVRTEQADEIQRMILESGPTPGGPFMKAYTAKLNQLLAKPDLSKAERAEYENKLKDSLQLVEDANTKGEEEGQGPYAPAPMVPDIDVTSGARKKGDDGQIVMKAAPRTLVVVQCRTPSGRDCSTKQSDLDRGRAALDCNPGSKADPVPQTVDPFTAMLKGIFGG